MVVLFLSWHYQTCFHVAISYGYEHRADYMYSTLLPPYIIMYKLNGYKQKQKLPNCPLFVADHKLIEVATSHFSH